MLGLGSLKDKIANLGEGLKSQFSVEVEPVSAESDLTAGSAVLTHYQACWREIHTRARAAGKEADRCDRCVGSHVNYFEESQKRARFLVI